MRIVCQKCSAAYAIDDKFVSPKGVRAQCPRCRHLQLVKKDEGAGQAPEAGAPPANPFAPAAPPAPNPFAPAAPNASPFSQTSPAAPGPFGGDGDSLFDLSSPASPTSPALAAMGGPAGAVGAPSPGASPDSRELDLGGLAVPPPPPRPGAGPFLAPAAGPGRAPAAPAASPFGSFGDDLFGAAGSQGDLAPLSTTGPEPSSFGALPQVAAPPAAAAPAPAVDAKCQSCGKAITDPFDVALGICDDCRSKPASPSAPIPPPAPAAAAPGAKAANPPPPAPVYPRPLTSAVMSANREGASGGGSKWLGIGIAVAALVAGGIFLAVKRPWVRKPPPLVRSTDVAAKPIEDMVNAWRLNFPELSGNASEYLAAGEEKLSRDTTSAYREAEEAFQKALVLDKKNDRAVAGWALALAFGRAGEIDDQTARAAEAMLTAAEQRSGDSRIYVAHAHFLLARNGPFNDIQALANRGKESASDRDRALAYLALGRSYLAKNPQYAAEHFGKAAKIDPKLKRALLFQAELLVQQGEVRAAVDAIEQRLAADPDQWEASDLLGRLYLEAGELAKARAVYLKIRDTSNKEPRTRIAMAVLAYQHENQAKQAVSQLEELLTEEEALTDQDVGDALSHLASAKRAAGDLAGAAAAATRALEKRPGDVNAHVQKLLVAIDKRDAGEARAQLAGVQGKLGDPALDLILQAMVLLAEGKAPEAADKAKEAYGRDKRRTDALLLAGAANAKAKRDTQTWELALKQGTRADPLQGAPVPVMARVFLRPQDVLRQARGAFEPLSQADEDPNPPVAEGLVAWFSGDLGAADKHFDQAARFDPGNTWAFAYRALIALRRNDASAAFKLATRAVGVGRDNALAHAALGAALLAQNKVEAAGTELNMASRLDPALNFARVKLAEVQVRQKRPAEARNQLSVALRADALYRDARRVQYLIGP